MRKTVAQYMTKVAYTVADDQSLVEAWLRMQELDVRHLPVMRGSRLVGILSQRDVALLKATSPAALDELKVEHAMTRHPFTVEPDTPLEDVARIMARERYGAAIVTERGEPRGIFTTTDGLNVLAEMLGRG